MPSGADDADASTLRLHVGDTHIVTLPENATTGFRWAPDQFDSDLIEVEPGGAAYPEGRVGAGGKASFTVRARRPGKTQLVMKNWRHWEGDDSTIDRYRLKIEIAP